MNQCQMMGRNLLMGQKSGGGGLPAEYQKVEWIESSGSQCLATNIYPTDKTRLKLKAFIGYTPRYIAGVRWSQAPSYDTFGVFFGSSITIYFGDYSQSKYYQKLDFAPNTVYEIDLDINDLSINDERIGISRDTFTTPAPLLIFGWNNNGRVFGASKIYYVQLYENGPIQNDFVPCYRKSDGVIGMYDLCGTICPLTNTPFYINAGTGTFTKGADVN